MRLDRFLCETGEGSRSQVKEWIKKGQVQVNDVVIKKPEFKVDEKNDSICCQGRLLTYEKFVYYMLNKPAGMVTAHQDSLSPAVMELLKEAPGRNLFPAGRLDKDSEGLLLITNDGLLAHQLLAPKSHVPKTYFLRLKEPFTKEQQEALLSGVDIGEKKICTGTDKSAYRYRDYNHHSGREISSGKTNACCCRQRSILLKTNFLRKSLSG